MRLRTAVLPLLFVLATALAGPAAADYKSGREAYVRGDYATAAKQLTPVVEGHAEDPDYAATFYMLGMSQGQLHQDKQAVSNLECAVRLEKDNATYALGLGQALLTDGQSERAYTTLKSLDAAALKLDQRKPHALLLANAALKTNHGAAAVEALQAGLAVSRGDADLLRALGATFRYLGRYEQAFAAFTDAFDADPEDLESGRTAVKIGLAQAARTTDEEARIRLYRRTADVARRLAEGSSGAETAVLAGEANLGARDFATALGWFQQAGKASPKDPVVLSYVAQALGHLGRSEEALAADGRALAASPDTKLRSRILNHVGDLHASRLELDEAADAYDKAGNAKRAGEMRKLGDDVRQARAQRDQLKSQVAKLEQTAAQLDVLGESDGAAKLRQRIGVMKGHIEGIDSNLARVKQALQID